MNKLLSGRFLLTLCAGGVWAYLAWAGTLDSAFHAGLITLIVQSYFTRADRPANGGP